MLLNIKNSPLKKNNVTWIYRYTLYPQNEINTSPNQRKIQIEGKVFQPLLFRAH